MAFAFNLLRAFWYQMRVERGAIDNLRDIEGNYEGSGSGNKENKNK